MKNIIEISYKKFIDSRGYFFELYNKKKIKKNFKQVNISCSKKNVIRGLHYQLNKPQEKFVTVLRGRILDVCVDLRNDSNTFGQYKSFLLDADKHCSIYIPIGFAHGFMSLSSNTLVCYFTSNFYDPESEKTLLWNDPNIKIKWPNLKKIIISKKDRKGDFFDSKKKYF